MIEALVPVDTKQKVSLSVPLIATYLKRGVNYSDIARICNISKQAVSSYIKTHYNDLAPLVDKTDNLAAAQAQHIANKAQERLLLHLSDSEKKDLFALNAISGTHIDKYRLLSDKSTANVSIDQITASREELRARKEVLQARLKELRGR